jgi:hypothetical protein
MEAVRDLSWKLGFQAEAEEAHTGFRTRATAVRGRQLPLQMEAFPSAWANRGPASEAKGAGVQGLALRRKS